MHDVLGIADADRAVPRRRQDAVRRAGGAAVIEYSGTPWSVFKRGVAAIPQAVVLLAPALPSKIVASDSITATTPPRWARPFPTSCDLLKPVSALIGPDDPIVLPPQSTRVEHEAELAVVVKKRSATSRRSACASTCWATLPQRRHRARHPGPRPRPTRAKAFDTFCPVGPCIATDLEPNAVTVEAFVNGVVRQSGSTKDFVFP